MSIKVIYPEVEAIPGPLEAKGATKAEVSSSTGVKKHNNEVIAGTHVTETPAAHAGSGNQVPPPAAQGVNPVPMHMGVPCTMPCYYPYPAYPAYYPYPAYPAYYPYYLCDTSYYPVPYTYYYCCSPVADPVADPVASAAAQAGSMAGVKPRGIRGSMGDWEWEFFKDEFLSKYFAWSESEALWRQQSALERRPTQGEMTERVEDARMMECLRHIKLDHQQHFMY